jgi:cytochrome c biogenesis protein CcmG/thiol:disulfide interchange protein DsbE
VQSLRVPEGFRVARAALVTALITALLAAAGSAASAASAVPAAAAPFDLSHHRGRVVIIDFWASWCKPCRQSIPWLNTLRERYGASGLTVIGVNVDAERGDAERFLRDVPIEFEVIFDPRGDVARSFNLRAMPSTYVFDRHGRLVATHLGFREAKTREREAELKTLLDAATH